MTRRLESRRYQIQTLKSKGSKMNKSLSSFFKALSRLMGPIGLMGLMAAGLVLAGCSSFGKNAKPPTAFEQRLFSVETRSVPQAVVITNIIPIFQPNQVIERKIVKITNQV